MASRIVIVGGGLTGALAAVRLHEAGHAVSLHERREDPRRSTEHQGRSINLAFSTRGLDALDRVGLSETLREHGIPMRGRMLHGRDRSVTFQPYSADPANVLLSVSRDGLNAMLLDAVDERQIPTHFGQRLVDIELKASNAVFEVGQGRQSELFEVLIGADGAYSAVRNRLQRTDRFTYEQNYLEHGYKELTIPARADGSFAMEPHALHIWPRGGHMMIALPNPDGSFTCTLFWPFGGPVGFERVDTEREVNETFLDQFPDAVELMPHLTDEYLHHSTSSLVTIRCGPWFYEDRVVLLGDAAHAVVPFYGQGANAALEDVTIFIDLLAANDGAWGPTMASFYAQRKPDTDALADLALDNFVEMRDRVASPLFRLRVRAEQRVHRWAPRWITPLYEMVTFSRTPYVEAVARAKRQTALVERLMLALVALVLLVVVATIVLVVV
ncbi:MAG: NAD(P)/FAD-dependent oxidoreductase [Acidimicrobiales bacterium]